MVELFLIVNHFRVSPSREKSEEENGWEEENEGWEVTMDRMSDELVD